MTMELRRQHLIDPAICIRCNTCEEMCPVGAITHDANTYVVNYEICDGNGACLGPCPTGAIDSWRLVATPYSLEEQFSWFDLPEEQAHPVDDGALPRETGTPPEVEAIVAKATAAQGGKVPPPYSAAHPYVGLYTRDRPARAVVQGNYRITGEGTETDIRHVVLDFGTQAFPVLEGQSIGIQMPGTDSRGQPHVVRLYSVASPRDGERPNHNNLSLTVKRVEGGQCSNYVCDLKKGDEVMVTGPFGDAFLMPNHADANIIMICTGTGSAPFRAMTERRRRHGPRGPGKLLLFFGARTPEELPYFGPLMKLPGSLIDVNLAFSRVPDKRKEYVQDKMRERADDVAALLRDANTYVYICGLKGMERGCEETLSDVCRHAGLDWQDLAARMRREGRYHVETY